MKRKDILNKLKLEVENSMPQDVLEKTKKAKVEKDLTPIYDQLNNADSIAVKSNIRIVSLTFAFTFLFFMLLVAVLPIVNTLLNPKPIITSKIGIEINPSIEILLDQDDRVALCIANNSHAELLLAGEEMKGLTYGDAVEKIIKLATQAGYISTMAEDEEIENAVLVTSASDNEKKQSEILGSIQAKIKSFYLRNQIYGVVLTEYESKEDLVNTVLNLNPNYTLKQKEELMTYSVKNLNQLIHDNYTQLKHRFRTDFNLEQVNNNVNKVQTAYFNEVNRIEKLLSDLDAKYKNFDANWQAENDLLIQKIAEWQVQKAEKQAQLDACQDQATKIELQREIDTLTLFISSEQSELDRRVNNKELFDFYKDEIVKKIENYKNQLDQKYLEYQNNIETKLSETKQTILNSGDSAKNRKSNAIDKTKDEYNRHFNSLGDYNQFYINYNNWTTENAEKMNILKSNWEEVKRNWEAKFASYIKN